MNVVVDIYSDVRKQNGVKMFRYIYLGIIISNLRSDVCLDYFLSFLNFALR